MFTYKFNDFLMYQLGSLFGSHTPLRQINMVGSYVTLYFSPSSSEYIIGGYQSYNPGMDFDHDAAHSTNYLRIFIDKHFTHVHVILPGKDSLDLELKNLLMSDKSKYGISELQIDHCVQQYQRHVESYSSIEHKQAVHNLIRSVIRYHTIPSKDDNIINHNEIDQSIRPVKKALVESMIEPKYSKLEELRQILQNVLISIDPKNKNTFVESLTKIMPYSPLKDFDRLMSSNVSGEPSLLGIMLLITPAFLFLLMVNLHIKIRSREFENHLPVYREEPKTPFSLLVTYVDHHLLAHQNELNSSVLVCIALLIFGYWTYNAPEISETIYNQLGHALYGEKTYVDNKELKKLVDDSLISNLEKIKDYGQYEQNTEEMSGSPIAIGSF